MLIKRGDIYLADLDPAVGSEQGGTRPILVVQNDYGNLHSRTLICAPITSRMDKTDIPTHVYLDPWDNPVTTESYVLMEQLRTIDRARLKHRMGHISDTVMPEVEQALRISIGLEEPFPELKRSMQAK